MRYRIQARAIGPLLRSQQILCAMVEQQNDLGATASCSVLGSAFSRTMVASSLAITHYIAESWQNVTYSNALQIHHCRA